jgi:tRNA G18 (ribose-2'-O)-methylase SpoU
MIVIEDPDDPRVAMFRLNERGLTNRPQRRIDEGGGLFMAEGDLVVERALDAGCIPVLALVDRDRPPAVVDRLAQHVSVYAGGDRLRASVTKLGMPYDVVALFERPPRTTEVLLAAEATRLILIEAVDNPANIGSIVRNALGLGWHGLIIDTTSADPLARRALRVSMGQALHLPHARVADLARSAEGLKTQGWTVCALTPSSDAIPLDDLPPEVLTSSAKVALVVGSERTGLTPVIMAAATYRVCIPMHSGVDSLNAAAATAVACWHLRPR